MSAFHLAGVLLPDGDSRQLWVSGGRISLEPISGAETIARSGWIMPGLVDVHCHVGLGHSGPVTERGEQQKQAYADRDVGTLLIRDAGSPVDTGWLDKDPHAPRIIRAGRHLAAPRRYLRDVAVECGPDELAAQVRLQAAAGDGWVKIVGDWIDRAAGDLAPEWPRDALLAAVAAAHAVGARVAVHTFGEEALPDLIDAGVDSIEHGTGLTAEMIPELANRRTALVPTLVNVATFPEIAASASRFPRYAARIRRLHSTSVRRFQNAHDAGVPIYAGTDAGGTIEHGRIVDEIRALHAAGMSRCDALAAGSWRARDWLGLPGITEGAPADLLVFDSDPRADLGALNSPVRIVLKGNLIR